MMLEPGRLIFKKLVLVLGSYPVNLWCHLHGVFQGSVLYKYTLSSFLHFWSKCIDRNTYQEDSLQKGCLPSAAVRGVPRGPWAWVIPEMVEYHSTDSVCRDA